MMKVQFSFDKMVSSWHPTQGAGTDGMLTIDVSWMDETRKISSVSEVQGILVKSLDDMGFATDYFAIMDDGRISFNQIEDGNGRWIEDTEEQNRMFQRGEKLYLADYNIYIEIQKAYEPDVKELEELFPNAEMMAG